MNRCRQQRGGLSNCGKRLRRSSSASSNLWIDYWSVLLANGHVLLEGVPGLAKTMSVRTLATAIHASFHRIQFTPDLLPADIVGTLIYSPQDGKYHATKGPVFANFVLADEINRAPAKVQSALLETMQERQVTLGGETMPLPSPFLVLAPRTPSTRRERIHYPKRKWTDSCLRSCSTILRSKKNEKSSTEWHSPHPRLASNQWLHSKRYKDPQVGGSNSCGRKSARLRRASRFRDSQA